MIEKLLSSGKLYNESSNIRREEGDNMACKFMNCIKFCSEECKDTCKTANIFLVNTVRVIAKGMNMSLLSEILYIKGK